MLVNKFKLKKQLISKYGVHKGYKFLIDYFYLQNYLNSMKQTGAKGFVPSVFYEKLASEKFSNYLKAEFYFYLGEFEKSKEYLLENIEKKHIESFYLLSEIYRYENNNEKALNLLYKVLDFSNRHKTWLYISRNILNKENFDYFNERFNCLILLKNKKISYELFSYYSDAAMNAQKFDYALNIWKIHSKKIIKKAKKKVEFNVLSANKVLKDLKLTLGEDQFFLVSGTLLGVVRDNSILEHDKDLDIGIFFERKLDVLDLLKKSGCFEILPCRTPYQIKVKHFNGTYIDIFFHKEIDDYYWHYTSKIKWFNRKFNLIKYFYDNEFYLIPEDYSLYLTENYGMNWTVPVKDFDSTFDTPNAVIYNEIEMKLFEIKQKFIL